MGRTFVSADAGRSLLPLYGPAQQAPWQGLLAMSWALTGMWQKGQVPFRAPRREAGPASVSVRVASQRAAHWSCPDLADRFDCLNQVDALVSNSIGDT